MPYAVDMVFGTRRKVRHDMKRIARWETGFSLGLILGLAALPLGCSSGTGETETTQAQTQMMQGNTGGSASEMGGHMMSMGDMMGTMQNMHGRFQELSQQDRWMQQGTMMSGGQHMMSMARQLANTSESMRQAMNDMQTLMQQDLGQANENRLQQMQGHMKSMTDQLDAIEGLMSQMPMESASRPSSGD
jgi:hypothetical protein